MQIHFKESDSIFHFEREPVIPTLETAVKLRQNTQAVTKNLKQSDPCISESRKDQTEAHARPQR